MQAKLCVRALGTHHKVELDGGRRPRQLSAKRRSRVTIPAARARASFPLVLTLASRQLGAQRVGHLTPHNSINPNILPVFRPSPFCEDLVTRVCESFSFRILRTVQFPAPAPDGKKPTHLDYWTSSWLAIPPFHRPSTLPSLDPSLAEPLSLKQDEHGTA